MNTELRTTSDGSHTLFVPEIDESYHSTHGAIQESRFIFINEALKLCKKKEITILEIGFGTGLNAFLALNETETNNKQIHYITLEKYPVPLEQVALLNYSEIISPDKKGLFELMHYWQWNQPVQLTSQFLLEKIYTDFSTFNHSAQYDVVFFDAFSPEKQPEMWSEEVFSCIFAACNSGAILTTYCAKGSVRRLLQQVGFLVERLPGPIGKREILRARKP